ncbi:glycosyltransferase [Aerococcus urinaeequi]|uniref:glycosyltransferase n=1 Tax=Aerococcus urinaeequi TaxID=51665 RepID=UPI003D6A6D45
MVIWKKIVKQNKVKIIKNGIDVSNYLINEKRRNDNREKYGINESTLVIGHVGRFTYAKNHKFLLEVFNDIHNKTNNSKLILVGDGELKPKIKQYIAENNLDDSVIFTGVTNNVPMFLEIMDVYVFPSHYEGLSLSAVEAQASGLLSFLSTSNSTEVKLTDLVHFLPLEYNEEKWSKEILAKVSLINRRSHSNEVKNAGFDISETVIILSNFYLELVD